MGVGLQCFICAGDCQTLQVLPCGQTDHHVCIRCLRRLLNETQSCPWCRCRWNVDGTVVQDPPLMLRVAKKLHCDASPLKHETVILTALVERVRAQYTTM